MSQKVDVSAPPPLRQCDKGAYYKLDPEPAFSEARYALTPSTIAVRVLMLFCRQIALVLRCYGDTRADYLLVKSLLESSEIPYVVTPGGEDCTLSSQTLDPRP
eukprot:2401498-Rhodomonas_salina.1